MTITPESRPPIPSGIPRRAASIAPSSPAERDRRVASARVGEGTLSPDRRHPEVAFPPDVRPTPSEAPPATPETPHPRVAENTKQLANLNFFPITPTATNMYELMNGNLVVRVDPQNGAYGILTDYEKTIIPSHVRALAVGSDPISTTPNLQVRQSNKYYGGTEYLVYSLNGSGGGADAATQERLDAQRETPLSEQLQNAGFTENTATPGVWEKDFVQGKRTQRVVAVMEEGKLSRLLKPFSPEHLEPFQLDEQTKILGARQEIRRSPFDEDVTDSITLDTPKARLDVSTQFAGGVGNVHRKATAPEELGLPPGNETVTAQQLGLEPSTTRLGNRAPIEITTANDGNERIYCAVFPGVSGQRFRDTLVASTAEPNQNEGSVGIELDWNIYDEAKKYEDVRNRLKRHVRDPEIGDAMEQFGQEYVDRWRRANAQDHDLTRLVDNYSPALDSASSTVIVDMTTYPQSFFDAQRTAPTEALANTIMGDYSYTDAYSLQHFNNFLETHPEFPKSLQYIKRSDPNASWYQDIPPSGVSHWLNTFRAHPKALQRQVYNAYADWLNEHPKIRDNQIISMITQQHMVIDVGAPGQPTIYPAGGLSLERPLSAIRSRPNEVTIQDTGIEVSLTYVPDSTPLQPTKVVSQDVHLSGEQMKQGLYPVVAWKRTPHGTRTFLSRQEIQARFGEHFADRAGISPEKLDDWLGVIVAGGGYSPEVRADTPEEAPLHRISSPSDVIAGKAKTEGVVIPGRVKNAIGPAQVPVFYNTKSAREKILADQTGALAKIEQYMDQRQVA